MFDQEEQQPESYPHTDDTEFTPDEQEAIREYKLSLKKRLDKNSSKLKGLESAFWGISSFSIARFVILNWGVAGVLPAISICMLVNQITNRDLLEKVNIDYQEGWRTEGMAKLIRFSISLCSAGFVAWMAVGDILSLKHQSQTTYKQLQETVEEFNALPENQQNTALIAGGILGLAGIYAIYDKVSKR